MANYHICCRYFFQQLALLLILFLLIIVYVLEWNCHQPCYHCKLFYFIHLYTLPYLVLNLVALVLDMSRTRPGLVPTVPFLGQCPVFMGTQDRLQNVSHGSVTCPSCPATRLWVKNNRASHRPKITVTDQK